MFLYVGIHLIPSLEDSLELFLIKLVFILFGLVCILIGYRFIDLISLYLEKQITKKTQASVYKQAIPYSARIIKVLLTINYSTSAFSKHGV